MKTAASGRLVLQIIYCGFIVETQYGIRHELIFHCTTFVINCAQELNMDKTNTTFPGQNKRENRS